MPSGMDDMKLKALLAASAAVFCCASVALAGPQAEALH